MMSVEYRSFLHLGTLAEFESEDKWVITFADPVQLGALIGHSVADGHRGLDTYAVPLNWIFV